eukprot:1894641-Pyramimonas_sp.AAC.1
MEDSHDFIAEEIEAVQAVYFNECTVECVWPPRIKLELNPLTAEDVTQQFVRATLVIEASSQVRLRLPHQTCPAYVIPRLLTKVSDRKSEKL